MSGSASNPAATEERRGFLAQLVALGLWLAALLPAALAGIVSFFSPWKAASAAEAEFVRLTALDVLAIGGPPQRFPVIDDRTDAWNRFPDEPIGAVLLRRVSEAEVEAVNVICPHAGCFVNYDAGGKQYHCPCHEAYFDLEGKRLQVNSPSPRDLDRLDVEVREGGEVWVRFQNFELGTSQQIPKA